MVKSRTLERVKLGDNRELRITRIDTGYGKLIRVGAYLTPSGEALSGAVFPAAALKDVIAALAKVDARGD